MKKRISKICSILTASALLAVSVTAYAESDDIEAGFQAEEESDVPMETQEFQTETGSLESETEQKKEENGLDTFLYVREKENTAGDEEEKITVRKVTLDELKEEIKEDKKPELAAVVFQFAQDDTEESETQAQTETQQETETQTEKTEKETEETKETKETKEKYPTVELSDLQKEIVYEVAELAPQTVVLLNQCEVEDSLMFKKYKQVKAVTVVKAAGEKELEKTIEKYDLEKEYTSYLKLQAVEKAVSAKSQARTSALTQTETTKSLSQMPQMQTESQTTASPSNRAAGSSSGSTSGSSSTSGSASTSESTAASGTTTTGAKDVTITFEPDDVYSGEESVSASYSVSSTKEVTYGKVTVTYDTNIMKFDDVNAEDSDALEGMTVKVTKPTDSGGTEGKIVIEFSSTTPKKLEGTLVDLWFNLTSNATTGQQFNISMTVDELRNGSTNLTSEVKTASMVAQADEDSETETTAQTTPSTTASTTAQTTATTETSAPQNAPKTGDTANAPMMALMMTGSAAVYFAMKKKRKRV